MEEEKFEFEIRFPINKIEEFTQRIKSLEGEVFRNYSFYDHIYIPLKVNKEEWDLIKKVLRIREWFKPEKMVEILFSKVSIIQEDNMKFKRSKYPQGKIKLFKGNLETAKMLLNDLGFHHWFTVKKLAGQLIKINRPFEFVVAVEKIEKVGWMGEIEFWGKNSKEAKKSFKLIIDTLGISSKEIIFKTMPRIVAEKLSLI